MCSNDLLVENEDSEIDLYSIHEEFDELIHELHRKLQYAKEERKKSQAEAKTLQHRVMLLHNQEKLAQQRFERTKHKLDKIIDNRKFFNQSSKVSKAIQSSKNNRIDQLREQAKKQRENLKKSQSFQSLRDRTSSSRDFRVLQHIRDHSLVTFFNFINLFRIRKYLSRVKQRS